jgi:hypothetical protein
VYGHLLDGHFAAQPTTGSGGKVALHRREIEGSSQVHLDNVTGMTDSRVVTPMDSQNIVV